MKKHSTQLWFILVAALLCIIYPCQAGKLAPVCTSYPIRGLRGTITLDFSKAKEKQVRKQILSTGLIFNIAHQALDTTGGGQNVRYSFSFDDGKLSSVSSDTLLAVKRDTADRYPFDRAGDLLYEIGGEEIDNIVPNATTLKTYHFPAITCGERYVIYLMELIRQDTSYVVTTTALVL